MWRCEVVDHGEYLVRELASHILKEDNVLYRAALQAFSAEEWEQVRRESDAIGYCRCRPRGPARAPDGGAGHALGASPAAPGQDHGRLEADCPPAPGCG